MCPQSARAPLLELTGWAWELNLEDCLHTIFLGVGADLVAAVLVKLCQWGWYGGGNLRWQLLRCCSEARRRCQSPLPDFTPELLNVESDLTEPFMRTKAAIVKELLQFVSAEAELFWIASGGWEAGLVLQAAEGLAGFVRQLDMAPWIMDPGVIAASYCSLQRYQQAHAQLQVASAGAADAVQWKVRPKYHVLEHIAATMRETRVNPRFWACWMDEDFMAKIRGICERTRAGGAAVCKRALTRYALARAEMLHVHQQHETCAAGHCLGCCSPGA